MNNKKYLLIITIAFISGILFATAYNMESKKLATDSGFDSSWDSGSSSSSSHSSSSSSSGGSSKHRKLTPEEERQVYITASYTFLLPAVGYWLRILFKRKKEEEKFVPEYIFGFLFLIPSTLMGYLYGALFTNIIDKVFLWLAIIFLIFELIRKKKYHEYVKPYLLLALISFLILTVILFFNNRMIEGFVLSVMLGVSSFILLIIKLITKKSIISDIPNFVDGCYKVFTPITDEEIEAKKKELLEKNSLNEEKICHDAYEIYKRIQIAWMNDSISDVDDCLSDEIKNMYNAQLLTLRLKNQQNVMSDFDYIEGYIENIEELNNNNLKIYITLEVKCKDYLINKENGKVLRGDKDKIRNYVYDLEFIINRELPKNCPNCGHVLKKGGGVECPTCKSKVKLNNGNMMMVDKRMISQS